MAGSSKIEWTDKTYNPIVGCSIVSPGCTNCYAMKMAARIEAMAETRRECLLGPMTHYAGTTKKVNGNAVWTGKVAQAPAHILTAPLHWRKPCRIFVNSMGDLFHESIPDEWIDKVFAVMALCPQHTFQVLTKRAERMRAYLSAARAHPVGMEAMGLTLDAMARDPRSKVGEGIILKGDIAHLAIWPLPNVWLGVSCERQQEADERIPHLLQTPAAIRFVSAEPLLGPIDFTHIKCDVPPATFYVDAVAKPGNSLDWIIVGGESGPNARPMYPDWARSIRDECAAAGVTFFFKQWGGYAPVENDLHPAAVYVSHKGELLEEGYTGYSGFEVMIRVGKKRAGRLLDGREHNEFPVIDSSVSQPGLSPPDSKTEEKATA